MTRGLYLIWTLLVVTIFSIIVERTYTYAQYIAKQNTDTMVKKDIVYRNWVASHGGVYVPVDKKTPPNPYLAHIKDRDFSVNGKNFTLMNPAYTLRQMMQQYTDEFGIKTKITSKLLLNPINKADSWETIALNKIEKVRTRYFEFIDIDDKPYLRSMTPLFTKKGCLKCHAFQGYKVGDIRGGVSVAIPMEPLYTDARNSSLILAVFFFIILLSGLFAINLFTKKIYKYMDEKELLYEEYIYGLVSVVEKRDSYTAGHSTRVAQYAEMIAQEMGFSEYDCHILHRAGMLHDIGKVAIPDSIFLKPSKLSLGEYKLIQEHVEMSYEMLKNISIFDEIKEIVRDHHEHYDGSGYPRGLIGEDTPILAQVLTLADAFDAMTTDRIYKGRKSVKEALLELAKLSGKQFNPKVVQAALFILKDIIIDHTKHQAPVTALEKERFSYFYKDSLTNAYNEEYLHSDIKTIATSNIIIWLSLKNFHAYNKEKGWSSGDDILKSISNIAKTKCQNSLGIYRFYGDNFLVLVNTQEEAQEYKKYINELLEKENIAYKFKTNESQSRDNIKDLEDVLKKLF